MPLDHQLVFKTAIGGNTHAHSQDLLPPSALTYSREAQTLHAHPRCSFPYNALMHMFWLCSGAAARGPAALKEHTTRLLEAWVLVAALSMTRAIECEPTAASSERALKKRTLTIDPAASVCWPPALDRSPTVLGVGVGFIALPITPLGGFPDDSGLDALDDNATAIARRFLKVAAAAKASSQDLTGDTSSETTKGGGRTELFEWVHWLFSLLSCATVMTSFMGPIILGSVLINCTHACSDKNLYPHAAGGSKCFI